MTVNKLYEIVTKQIRLGNGDKEIVISNDDEGNGFHYLAFGFTTNQELVYEILSSAYCDYMLKDYKNIVILG
jgi:hypothetical protein